MKKNKKSAQVIEFIENLHLCGDYHGQKCKLRKWQRRIFSRLFETDRDGNLIVRRALLMLPRKSSKTWMCAAICLYALLTFGPSQVIIAAASSGKQAAKVFEAMEEIIRQDDYLFSVLDIIKSDANGRIVYLATGSYFRAIASGGKSALGDNPTVVVLDELLAWTTKNHRSLFASLTTGRGARKNPLTIMISTQTDQRLSLAGEEFDYACRIKNRIENGEVRTDGEIDNPQYLSVLYFAKETDNWHDRKLWHRVSPALSDFLDISEYEEQYKLACDIPSRASFFKSFYLNMPVSGAERWLNMSAWRSLVEPFDIPDGAEGWFALDLAPVNDLSSLVAIFNLNGKLIVRNWNWCSEDDIATRTIDEKVPYIDWEKAGFIKATPGNCTDFDMIEDDIVALSKKYKIKTLAMDQAHGFQVGQHLSEKNGINVQWFRQGFLSMGPATARTEKLILEGSLSHDGNKVLDYCLGNVRCATDAAGNQKPDNKQRLKHEKIDAAVALIMAVGVQMTQPKASVYETRGPLII